MKHWFKNIYTDLTISAINKWKKTIAYVYWFFKIFETKRLYRQIGVLIEIQSPPPPLPALQDNVDTARTPVVTSTTGFNEILMCYLHLVANKTARRNQLYILKNMYFDKFKVFLRFKIDQTDRVLGLRRGNCFTGRSGYRWWPRRLEAWTDPQIKYSSAAFAAAFWPRAE